MARRLAVTAPGANHPVVNSHEIPCEIGPARNACLESISLVIVNRPSSATTATRETSVEKGPFAQ